MNTAMIWGASGGIGRAILGRLDEQGWTTVAISRHPDDVADLTLYAIPADVSDPDDAQDAISEARQYVTEVDLWIYAAGDIVAKKVEEMDFETWKRILGANLTGAYITTHASLPILAERAHLFYLGAHDERMRLPRLSAYAAAKAGLEAFVEAMGKEHRKRRVTLVRPQAVATVLWEKVPFKLPANAMTPGALADQIIAAYEARHHGVLDL